MCLHIGIVTPNFPPDLCGLALYAKDLAHTLAEMNCLISVFTVTKNSAFPEREVVSPNLIVNRYNFQQEKEAYEIVISTGLSSMAKNWLLTQKILLYHKEKPFDVLEFSNWNAIGYYHSLNKIAPHVTRVSTGILQVFKDMNDTGGVEDISLVHQLATYEKISIENSDLIIASTLSHWIDIKNKYSIRSSMADKLKLIPLGIEIPDLGRRKALGGRKEHTFNILYVGRLTHRKGFDLFVKAIINVLTFAENADRRINVTIFGEDAASGNIGMSNWNVFRQQLPANFCHQVNYLGQTDDREKERAYHNADVFVSTSRYESFGLCLVEAMAYGIPIVGFTDVGLSSIIPEDSCGIFVPQWDTDKLSDSIQFLINNRELGEEIGKFGNLYALENFNRIRMAEKTLVEYQKLKKSTQ